MPADAPTMRPNATLDWLLPLALWASGLSAAWTWLRARNSLWEDEIIAITHGLQHGWLFFSEILRNDIHQFVYYLLLKGWTSFNFGSDAWALSSSLILMVLNACLLAAVVRREFGPREALWASGVFCALPAFAWSAANLRMYALIPGLVLLAWWANRAVLRSTHKGAFLGLFLAEAALVGTHAIGFYFVFFLAIASALQGWSSSDRTMRKRWLLAQLGVAVVAAPLALATMLRGTPMHVESPSLWGLLGTGAELMYPEGVGDTPFLKAVGPLLLPVLILLGCWHRGARSLVLAMPVAALVVGVGVSALGKPMFKAPVYAAHLMPFLAIGAGVGIARLSGSIRPLIGLGVTGLAALSCWQWIGHTHIPENFKPAGEYLQAHAQPGDVVVAPSLSVFWGVLRYSGQPAWGEPLTVMPLTSNSVWTRIKQKLGPTVSERLGLNPTTDTVEIRGVRYVIANQPASQPAAGGRIWVVHRVRYIEPVTLPTPGQIAAVTWFGKELAVTEVQPRQGGLTEVLNPTP